MLDRAGFWFHLHAAIRALWLALVVRLALWAIPTAGLLAVLRWMRKIPGARRKPSFPALAAMVEDALGRANRWGLVPNTCLTRALAQFWLLRSSQGIFLQLGFSAEKGKRVGHAWLRCHEGDDHPLTRQWHVIFTFPNAPEDKHRFVLQKGLSPGSARHLNSGAFLRS